MDKILIVSVLLAAVISCVSAVNCTAKANGAYDKGCRSYTVCTDGVGSTVECPRGKVFNNNTNLCDDPANVPAPCGVMKDCSALADGSYPDRDQNCHSYYTCYNKKFFGHSFCSADLVFDDKLGICNWPENVPSPCGTMQ